MNATALVMREERNGGHLGWRASCSTPCLSSENEFLEMGQGREGERNSGREEERVSVKTTSEMYCMVPNFEGHNFHRMAFFKFSLKQFSWITRILIATPTSR